MYVTTRVRFVTLLAAGGLAAWPHLAAAAGTVGSGTPASCNETALDIALSGGGSVTFNCGGAVTISLSTTKTIALDTAIDGGGLITLDGSGLASNMIDVLAGATLTATNLTFIDGNLTLGEAEIGNAGTVVATDCTFANNAKGFGIFNDGGVVTATDCTFSSNAQGLFDTGGIATVANCTFSGNGQGIHTRGTVTAVNSTFSGNVVNGIFNTSGMVTVTNCTIAGSSAGAGIEAGTIATLTNTIVADNPGGNCTGGIVDNGHNLEDGTSCGFSASGSLSSTLAGFDPAGLANNGGPTETIALLASSAAVDGGDDTVCSAPPVNGVDQRGFARPGVGHTHCSIGAYEFYLAALASPTPTETETVTPTAIVTATPTETNTPALVPLIKLQCMDGGWRNFSLPRLFKNQGDCIRFVNTGK